MTVASDARLTEVDKTAQAAKKKEEAAKHALLRKDFDETFSSAAGRNTLREIMKICGYDRSPVVGDQFGNPLGEGTIYNAAQANVYRVIRRYLKKEILIAVEHGGLEKDEIDDLLS
jgi:hypothetical protein